MEQEAVALGHDVQVVDPDVRGYVYSLVTAVSILPWSYWNSPTDVIYDLAGRFQWRGR